MTVVIVIAIYLSLLLALGIISSTFFRGTSKDYFVASHSIGPFLLLMSVFGTTMTAFALVGSTGKSFERGIGVYGLMASSSGLIHAACFFLIGVRLWAFGKRYGYVTQIQFFRERFESNTIGYVLFPILVGLVIPYLLIGVIGAGKTLLPATAGAFPELFSNSATPQWAGGLPPWLSGLVICVIVCVYVFLGGSRGAAWANTFQTIVFMVMGLVAFIFISNSLGGLTNASKVAATIQDGKLVQTHMFDKEQDKVVKRQTPKVIGTVKPAHEGGKMSSQPSLARTEVLATHKVIDKKTKKPVVNENGETETWTREYGIPPLTFLSYLFIPLSVGMFPHLFQHWLTAKSARAFRLTLIAHPLCIMVVWVPCVLIGAWASGLLPPSVPPAAVLSAVLKTLVHNEVLVGLLTAGVLAAIMSSLDSQFLCMGTIFTNDIVLHAAGKDKYTDKQTLWIARSFTIGIVVLTYILAQLMAKANVFDLAVWCFSGFGALFPLIFASLYWKRTTLAGAYACIIAVMGTWFYFFAESGFGGEYTVFGGVMPAAICFSAGAAALIIVSFMTKPPSQATIDKFFPKLEA